jgi:hypothetical protein
LAESAGKVQLPPPRPVLSFVMQMHGVAHLRDRVLAGSISYNVEPFSFAVSMATRVQGTERRSELESGDRGEAL